jgi:hypothetical protein
MTQPPDNKKSTNPGMWLAIGIAIGVALGVGMDNIAVGIAIGAGIGLALMATQGKSSKS